MTIVKTRARTKGRRGRLSILLAAAGCSDRGPEWVARNQQVIDKAKVTGRTRELPDVTVPTVLAPGVPVEGTRMPTATIAPGVSATLGWGRGALLERLEMQPGSIYPEQTLGEELIVIGRDGSATIEFDGKTTELLKDQVLYLQPGHAADGQGRSTRMEGVRGLFAGAAGSPRAGRAEHVRAEAVVSRSGCDALTPAGRGGESQRGSVDADHRSRHHEVRTVAALPSRACSGDVTRRSASCGWTRGRRFRSTCTPRISSPTRSEDRWIRE